MRVAGLVAVAFLVQCSTADQANADAEFNRDRAMQRNIEACQEEISLAIGIGVRRQEGKSRSWQVQNVEDNEAIAGDTREVLLNIVDELYSVLGLSGGTYALYRFESCLIHNWFNEARGSFDDMAESLIDCQNTTTREDLDGLVACIDAAIIRTRAAD